MSKPRQQKHAKAARLQHATSDHARNVQRAIKQQPQHAKAGAKSAGGAGRG